MIPVNINLRKRNIIELIGALKESPSFKDIPHSIIKEAVFKNEQLIFNRSTTKCQYVNAIKEKLNNIRNIKDEDELRNKSDYINGVSCRNNKAEPFLSNKPYMNIYNKYNLHDIPNEEYIKSDYYARDNLLPENVQKYNNRVKIEEQENFREGSGYEKNFTQNISQLSPNTMGRRTMTHNVSSGFHKAANSNIVVTTNDRKEIHGDQKMINVDERVNKIVSEKSNLYSSVNVHNDLSNTQILKDLKSRNERKIENFMSDGLSYSFSEGNYKNYKSENVESSLNVTKNDLLTLAKKIKSNEFCNKERKGGYDVGIQSDLNKGNDQHYYIENDYSSYDGLLGNIPSELREYLNSHYLHLVVIKDKGKWMDDLYYCYKNISKVKDVDRATQISVQYKYFRFEFISENILSKYANDIKLYIMREDEAYEEVLFNY